MDKKIMVKDAIFMVFIIIGIVVSIYFFSHKKSDKNEIQFGEQEAMRLMGEPIRMETFMLYSVDVKNVYEIQYGKDIWNQMTEDRFGNTVTYDIAAKEEIAEQIRMVQVLCKEAENRGITINSAEQENIDQSANEYFEDLKKAGVTEEGMSLEIIKEYYSDNYLAEKVFSQLQQEVEQGKNEQDDMEQEENTQEEIDHEEVEQEENTQEVIDQKEVGQAKINQVPVTDDTKLKVAENNESRNVETGNNFDDMSESEQHSIVQIIADLMEKYSSDYDYSCHINWPLMELLSFETELEDVLVSNEELNDPKETDTIKDKTEDKIENE